MFSFRKLTFLLLWLTILTIPFQNSFAIPGLGGINRVASFTMIVAAIFTVLIRQQIKKPPIVFGMIFLFVVWNITTYFFAANQEGAILHFSILIQMLLMTWAIFEFTDSTIQMHKLFKAYIYGCTVIISMTIYNYVNVDGGLEGSRFFLEAYNPNTLGSTLAFGIPLSFYLVLKGHKVFLFYLPLSLFAMFLTGSRTVLVAVGLILISIIWMLFRYKVRFRKTIFMILIIFTAFSINQIPQGQLDRLSTISSEITDGTLNKRTDIWQAGVKVFGENALIGVGAGNYGESVEKYMGVQVSAHNTFLSVFVENGIVGGSLFLVIVLSVFYYAWNIGKRSRFKWLSLTLFGAWLVISMVGHTELQKYTWLVFGFVIAMKSIEYNRTDEVEKEAVKEVRKKKFFKKRIVW